MSSVREPTYPLVPTRAALAEMTLAEPERVILAHLIRWQVKYSVIPDNDLIRDWTGLDEQQLSAVVEALVKKGTIVLSHAGPCPSYLARVLMDATDVCQYTYQEPWLEWQAEQWRGALDRADACGRSVEWDGDREDVLGPAAPYYKGDPTRYRDAQPH